MSSQYIGCPLRTACMAKNAAIITCSPRPANVMSTSVPASRFSPVNSYYGDSSKLRFRNGPKVPFQGPHGVIAFNGFREHCCRNSVCCSYYPCASAIFVSFRITVVSIDERNDWLHPAPCNPAHADNFYHASTGKKILRYYISRRVI